jgi:hypothetical protein
LHKADDDETAMSFRKYMTKFKSRISWLLGLIIAKLKSNTVLIKVVSHFRTSYPEIWRTLAKRLRPFYWSYQAQVLDDSDDAFFKDMSIFTEQQWQKKQSHMRTYNSESLRNGVMNNRPVVDPAVLLERINRSVAPKNR